MGPMQQRPATRQLRDAMLEAMSKIDALVAALKAKKLTSAAASVLKAPPSSRSPPPWRSPAPASEKR